MAIGSTVIAIVVIIIIVVAGIAAYLVTSTGVSSSSSTSTSSPSVTTATATATSTVVSTATSTVVSTVLPTSTVHFTTTGVPSSLTVDEYTPIVSVDPGTSIDLAGEEVIMNTNLPLIFFNCPCPKYTGYIPVLAKSLPTESPDGMTYTFNLRQGIYFSNGDPLNAYVVWYNFYRNMFMLQALDYVYLVYANTTGVTVGDLNSFNSPQNAPNSTLLSIMENPHLSATVLNSTAIQFHLMIPFVGFLPQVASGPPWNMADPYVVEQHGGVVANEPNAYMAANGTAIGDGPYIMQTYLSNEYAVLVANPHYWAASLPSSESNFMLQLPHIPKIEIDYKPTELTRALDLTNNRAQAAVILYSDLASVLSGDSHISVPHIGLTGTLEWLALNTFKAPFNNTLVRRAVIESINMSQIGQLVSHGYIAPINGPVLNGYFGYNASIKAPSYDVSDAQKLLVEAGYPGGKGLPPITYIYYQSEEASELAAILVNDLSQIGVTLVPEGLSSSAAISIFSLPPTDPKAPLLEGESWTYWPDFTAYEFVIDADLGVFVDFNNATINNLIYASNVELNPTIRAHQLSEIVQMVNQQAAYIWMGQDMDTFATGVGTGPIVWNNCLSGMFENTGFIGVDFAPISYSCSPS
jgi:peptide/nickel transport system substrate-binding protein